MRRKIFVNNLPGISEPIRRKIYASSWTTDQLILMDDDVKESLDLKDYDFDRKSVLDSVDESLSYIKKHSLRGFVCWFDENYPFILKQNDYNPFGFYYSGYIPKDFDKCLTVVGTRYPLNSSLTHAYRFGLEAGLNGFSLASGLAFGIDQASMLGALDAKTKVYGVLGCGLNVDYPINAFSIKKRIIDNGGALISLFSPYMPPLSFNFPRRNVILAQLSMTTLVVEAPAKSGALITANQALENGREVVVHKNGITSKGVQNLIREGAQVIEGFEDLVPNCIKVKRVEEGKRFDYRYRNSWFSL